MALRLTERDKKRIFYALLHDYPQFARNATQAQMFFSNEPNMLKEALEKIIAYEKEDYKLLIKLGKEIGMDLPPYEERNIDELIKEAEKYKTPE